MPTEVLQPDVMGAVQAAAAAHAATNATAAEPPTTAADADSSVSAPAAATMAATPATAQGEPELQRPRPAGFPMRKSKRPRRDDASGDDEPPSTKSRQISGYGAVGSTAVAERGSKSSKPFPDTDAYRMSLAMALRQAAQAERREVREQLRSDARRLGRCRRGMVGSASDRDAATQWEGGNEDEQLEQLRARIAEQRQTVDRLRKSLTGRKPGPQQDGAPALSQEELDEEIWEQRELCNVKLINVGRDEQELREREQKLQADRTVHMQMRKVVEAEDQLDFAAFPLLQQRYQLLRLLNKNGNTTVYRANDLFALQSCVVRVHRVQGANADARLKAAQEECERLKNLRHPHIIALLDYFPHESGSLATVWEYFEGDSLDVHLRRNGSLPEREVRCIVLQLLSALRYADAKGHRIRGQDLRSHRLTMRGGEVKVAGVALLLAVHTAASTSHSTGRALVRSPTACSEAELQHGAACEILEDDLHRADTASAVRAIGHTLHEALFNKLPEEPTGLPGLADLDSQSPAIQLPDQPRISSECREFVLRLLDRFHRLTVSEALGDPFMSLSRRKS